MSKFYDFTEDYPLEKEINEICKDIDNGAVIIFPTDTLPAIGCSVLNRDGVDKVLSISEKIDKKNKMTVLCKDIKTISDYTLPFSTSIFRSIKDQTPGPVTFILNATTQLGKILKESKKEIGVRIPSHPVLREILLTLEHPMISTSLPYNLESDAEGNWVAFEEKYKHQVDIFIKAEIEEVGESAILDCRNEEIEVIREGRVKND